MGVLIIIALLVVGVYIKPLIFGDSHFGARCCYSDSLDSSFRLYFRPGWLEPRVQGSTSGLKGVWCTCHGKGFEKHYRFNRETKKKGTVLGTLRAGQLPTLQVHHYHEMFNQRLQQPYTAATCSRCVQQIARDITYEHPLISSSCTRKDIHAARFLHTQVAWTTVLLMV